MNSKELRNLQEAYYNVYQNIDENQQMQGSLLTRRGTAQNFTSGRSPFTVAEPIQQGPRSSVSFPSPNSQVQSPGQLNIPRINQRSIDANIWSRARSSISPDMPNGRQSPRPAWDNLSPNDQNSRTPRIRGPFGRGLGTPPTPPTPTTTLGSKLSTLARLGRAGTALGLFLEPTPTSSTDTPGTAPGVSRFNTRDASGRIRNRLAVGQGKVGQGKVGSVSQSFDKEYAKQKSSGAKQFSFKGKQYTTDSYEPDLYDVILEHLITEGYADTNENALVIMGNMSEGWKQSIMEDEYKGDPRKIPTENGGSSSVGPKPKDKLVVPPIPVLPPPTRNGTYGGPTPSIGGGSIRSMPSPPSGPRGREFEHGNRGTKYTTPTKDGSAGSITLNTNKPGDDFIGPTVSSGGNTYGIPYPKFRRPQR